MAVVLRISRRGRKHRPFFHIVAADSRCPRDGAHLSLIGTYDPLGETALSVDMEKANQWLSKGAQPSATVKQLLRRAAKASAQSNA